MHAANKKVFNEKWCCGFALNRAVTTVSSFTVLIIGKVKCMKTQSLEQRRFSWSRPLGGFSIFDDHLKNEQTKETETYVLLLTDSQ